MPPTGKRKERVVILGSGWAGYAFARTLDPAKFDRIVISPRSYFVFTPLLASTSVGTLEFRAILEPVRRAKQVRFFQGWADVSISCVVEYLPFKLVSGGISNLKSLCG